MTLPPGRRWLLACVLTGVSALLGILIALSAGPSGLLDTADKLGSIGGFVVAAVGLVVSLVAGWAATRRVAPESTAPTDLLCDDLAVAVRSEWHPEARLRGLLDEPLQLRWHSTGRNVTASASAVVGTSIPGRPIRLRLSGGTSDLAATWRQLPARRLVVLGPPGAGKSSLAVLLLLELVEPPRPSDLVPVLFSIANWDPKAQTFDRWIAQQLGERYPALGGRYGADAAARLVERRRLLPILDGLDEVPASLRGAVLLALNDALATGGPVVVTCRAAEYDDAVAVAGAPLSQAAVLEIEPVDTASAIAYLTAEQIDGERRWAPVLAALQATPRGALTHVLDKPLLIHIARTVYRSAETDPADLVALPDSVAVERHLLERYIPSIYEPRPVDLAIAGRPSRRAYRPADACRWLAFLAAHLSVGGRQDLQWWELRRLLPKPRLGLAALAMLLVTCESIILVAGLDLSDGSMDIPALDTASQIRLAILVLGFAVLAGVVQLCTSPQAPKRIAPNLSSLWSKPPRAPQRAKPPVPRLAVGQVVMFAVIVTVVVMIPSVRQLLAFLIAGVAVIGLLVGPSVLVDQLTRSSIKIDAAVEPTDVLRTDRLASWLQAALSGLATTAVLMLFSPDGTALTTEPVVLAIVVLWIAQIAGMTTATGNYFLVRLWYAVRRQLPYDVMAFLSDAHGRGLLRQNGASYQFRHEALQRHLASVKQSETVRTGER